MAEQWRPVAGFEGAYEVSSYGAVRSLSRRLINRIGHPHTVRGRVLKPDVDKDGYLVFRVSAYGKKRVVKGHRLVAETFIGSCPDGYQVAHYDGNPANNRVSNLRYATCKDNHNDKRRHGRLPVGRKHGRSKIEEQDALYIRDSLDSNEALSKLYGLTTMQIKRIRDREFWRHV